MQRKKLNIIYLNEHGNMVNYQYNNSILVIEELLIEVNIVFEKSSNISPLIRHDSPPTMFDVYYVKGLRQDSSYPLMFDIQHIIDFEQYIQFPDPLARTRDKKY